MSIQMLLDRRVAAVVCTLLMSLTFGMSCVDAADLAEILQPLIERHSGQVAVAVKNLKTGDTFLHNADQPMPTASLIKFPLMVAAYQAIKDGRVERDKPITLREEDKVPGSGVLTQHFSSGTVLSFRDVIRLMIVYSDNTATNLVVDQIGLPATAELMEKLGLPETKLHSQVYRRETSIFPERSKLYGLGSTTAADMLLLYEKLSSNELVDEAACQEMVDHLYACDDKQKFPRFLKQARIAHKTGSVNATRTDAGWIDSPAGRIVLCVLTNENKDQSWGDENAAEILCGRIAERVYLHFNPEGLEPSDAVNGPLKVGANGLLVEGLQRTLNARMQPSPGLSVDGDFGPGTEAVVVEFQKSKGIEPNGVVGPETWAALGPIVEEDSGNGTADIIARAPADELAGPPFVTCKAWGIGDAATGQLLWGSDAEQPLDIASTTKMMTAYLTIRLATEHPGVLDETLTFSPRADQTVGSSATIRAGESLAVRELLYGLMLPSGNDASVALAEHFGHRLAGTEGDMAAAYSSFVSVMNKTAGELGMTHTHYVNPHGLSADGHKSSVSDLILLASRALQLPLFKDVVNTVRHECLVTGPAGYQRRLRWENTNQLLGIEGYDGVKTGTTTAAGACLVSHGTREGKSLIVVVLGSSSSDARYIDTRNLFRWAWNQK